ncbi:MAG: hypothetical protein AMS24_02480 [Chlamydiae bacterium SM23_39]|nr:MAG: hypothetical protein AMS24_02480 [Chlamydiae bacterium SM23_39]
MTNLEFLKKGDFKWKFFIGIIFFIALFLFFYFKEVEVETLELNTISDKYIVTKIDFEFPDEEGMIISKQDLLKNIGEIYKIDEEILRQVHYDFLNEISSTEKLRDDLENIYKTADVLKGILRRLRFVDENTKNIMEKYKIPNNNYLVFFDDSKDYPYLPKGYFKKDIFKKKLKEELFQVNEDIFNLIIGYFNSKSFLLSKDVKESKIIQEDISKTIPQKYTHIAKGTKIIGYGEKVTDKHVKMVSIMKEVIEKKKFSPFFIFGNILLSFIFVCLSYFYLKREHKDILKSLQKLSLLVCIFILTLAFAKIVEFLILQNSVNFLSVRYPIIVPFASILLLMLFNSRIALYGTSFLTIILTVFLAVDHNHFLLLNIGASIAIIVTTKSLRKRKEVFEVCFISLIWAISIILVFNLFDFYSFSYFLKDVLKSSIFMIIIAILVVGILPLLESLFNVMTDITLMEYMDPNNELLKKLTLEMPGTYQHSLVLGNLAEVTAQAIGANGLLCRVATLYHDIGKLNNANFFTENQQQGVNIHQLLTPIESAQVIISHVKDGVILAKKYKLPQSFIDIIEQHHGTTLVYYFYAKELELHGGDKSKVDINKFRYPGPKPQSKEAAIIMIADGIEAISRLEKGFTKQSLMKKIEEVIKDKIDDNQFDECDLTFKELKEIKDVLLHTLIATRHVRIEYPEKKD